MGYHVTILRTTSSGQSPIVKPEVERAAASLLGWRFDAEHGVATLVRDGREVVVLQWDAGELWAKNPSTEALAGMIDLAGTLGGRVRGDEFETYRTIDDAYLHPHDRAEKAAAEASGTDLVRKAKRNQWLLHGAIIGTFIALSLIVEKCSGS